MQRKFYRRTAAVFLPAIALLLIAGAANLFAQLNTAKIEGTITDQSTGQSMAGVQVTVEGTRLGNVTNADGYYCILNIPPGLRSITFSYT